MPQIIISLIENFALLLVLAFLIGRLPLRLIGNGKISEQVFLGILFGAATLISMMVPIQFAEGIFYDSRAILIALSGPFGGYLAPLVAGVIAGAYRVHIGGAGTLAGITALILPVILGLILVKFPLGDDRKLRFSKLALCGIVMGVLISPTALLLPDVKLGLQLLQTSVLTMPFILMLLYPLADAILNTQVWHNKIEETLRQSEEALREAQRTGRFGSWERDFKNNKVTWSDEIYRLMERDPALGPLREKDVHTYLQFESRERFVSNMTQALKHGRGSEDDYSLTLPSGRHVHHFVSLRPVKNEFDEVIKIIGTVQDITDRKNAEEQLRLTEAQRRALFKSIPVPINCWRQVGDDFELFDYNEAALIATDGKIAEVLGVKHSVFNSARPDILEEMKRCIALKETFAKENTHSFYTSGKIQEQILTFAYCPPNVAMVMTEDITDLKRNSRELELSERRFRDFASTAADDLWETDIDHRFIYFSSSFANDFPPMLGKTRWESEEIDQHNLIWAAHRSELDARHPFRDFRYSRSDETGRRRYLRVNGNPIFDENGDFRGYRGTTFDETDEVEAREAVRGVQEIFGEAMENVSEGIVLWDSSDRLVMRNSRYLEMFPDMAKFAEPNISRTKYIEKRRELGYSLYNPKDSENGPDEQENPDQSQNTIVEIFVKDGRLYQARREALANGRRIVFHTDVTDEKHREDQLHQALKMEAVGQLTGGIAHDFNNILSAVLGNLELVLQKWSSDEKLTSRINRAKISVLRGAELTRRLLAFSRKQNLNPKPAYLNDLVREMQDLLERTLGEHVTIKHTTEADLWPVQVDINLMENAILNLSINARDAMPVGGTLTLDCKNISAGKLAKLELTEKALGDCVCVEISDTGNGISPEHLERVFEPFFTTKDVGRGSGLGLSMVYGFVSQSGGAIEIESALERGTKVSLYLPRFEGEVKRVSEAENTRELMLGQGEKILVVEDDPDVRDMTLSLLARLGYKPYDCGDGRQLYDMASEDIQSFDMLLSDVVLPNGISGPMVAKHTREIAPEINVLLMTGYADQSALLDEDDKIQFPIINKPFRADELSRTLIEILG
ncbi:MAG: PAS domain S-box protein [Rhodospirillaceae bacterium]|nr:PAS domain S-box protein [Rhodospirillaceae bacterium]MBT5940582.1 PAS domain S-box protein [Rhodospirillaceae bacterium]MBT7267846.1 PAS domain S-box protein [Rhodospirillaceae bacterium]